MPLPFTNTELLVELRLLRVKGKKAMSIDIGGSTREEDLQRQALRREGLIEYVKGEGWRLTDKGDSWLSSKLAN